MFDKRALQTMRACCKQIDNFIRISRGIHVKFVSNIFLLNNYEICNISLICFRCVLYEAQFKVF